MAMSKMNEQEFIKSRMAAHKAGTSNIKDDPLVQAALAQHDANIQVKAAIAARKRGDTLLQEQTVEAPRAYRRQAG